MNKAFWTEGRETIDVLSDFEKIEDRLSTSEGKHDTHQERLSKIEEKQKANEERLSAVEPSEEKIGPESYFDELFQFMQIVVIFIIFCLGVVWITSIYFGPFIHWHTDEGILYWPPVEIGKHP